MYFAHAVGLMYRTGKLDVRSKPLEKKRKRGRPESFLFVWPGVPQTGILLTQMLSKMRKLQLSPVISAIYQPPLPEQHAEPELSHCPSAAPCTMFSFSQVNHLPRRERLLDSWPERLRSDITYNVLWSTIWQFLISFTHYFMTNNFCYP